MEKNQPSRTHCIMFELTPEGFKPLAKKAKQKAPPGNSRFTVEIYSSGRTTQSKVTS